MTDKYSRWTYTTWELPNHRKPELIAFEVFQREWTHSNLVIHYQGYIEFLKPYTQKQVKSLFNNPGLHVEPAIKSREMNIIYCTKPLEYAGHRYLFNGINEVYDEKDIEATFLTWYKITQLQLPRLRPI